MRSNGVSRVWNALGVPFASKRTMTKCHPRARRLSTRPGAGAAEVSSARKNSSDGQGECDTTGNDGGSRAQRPGLVIQFRPSKAAVKELNRSGSEFEGLAFAAQSSSDVPEVQSDQARLRNRLQGRFPSHPAAVADRPEADVTAVYSTLMPRSLVTLPQKATWLRMNFANSAGESLVTCCALTLLYSCPVARSFTTLTVIL